MIIDGLLSVGLVGAAQVSPAALQSVLHDKFGYNTGDVVSLGSCVGFLDTSDDFRSTDLLCLSILFLAGLLLLPSD